MTKKLGSLLVLPLLLLSACEDEAEPEEAAASQSDGTASGNVLGGTISDEMIPLEELTSTSPPAERTTTVTQETSSDGGRTVVETTIQTTTESPDALGESAEAPPQPEPPEPPAAPQ